MSWETAWRPHEPMNTPRGEVVMRFEAEYGDRRLKDQT